MMLVDATGDGDVDSDKVVDFLESEEALKDDPEVKLVLSDFHKSQGKMSMEMLIKRLEPVKGKVAAPLLDKRGATCVAIP
jgi:Ca2+-binding EF-hand superfamily protein